MIMTEILEKLRKSFMAKNAGHLMKTDIRETE